jgi:adenylate cyclase
VLFCDICGFSRTAEELEPEVLSEYLNEYFTPMTNIVLEQGGMLDKYIGDAIMAVYGAPLQLPDHAVRACRAALAMVDALEPLNRGFAARSLPAIRIGVGLSTGPMSVGNMGSAARFDFTVLGDSVNLGARLEALTRDYQVNVLCAEATARAAEGEFVFRELDSVRVRGRSGVGRIYELCGARGAARLSQGDLALHAEALAHYRAQRWAEAKSALERFTELHPDDGPARVLTARLAELTTRPPGSGWDGVYDQIHK